MINRFEYYKQAIQEGLLPKATIYVAVDTYESKGLFTEPEATALRELLDPTVVESEVVEETPAEE